MLPRPQSSTLFPYTTLFRSAQCDKKAYQFRLKWICEREENLDVKQGQTARLLHKDGQVYGVETTLKVQYLGRSEEQTSGLQSRLHLVCRLLLEKRKIQSFPS